MKLHVCSNCGTVIVFDVVFGKSGWTDTINLKGRFCKCPVCTNFISENTDGVPEETDKE
ncbi:MAG: hypothetical protein A4E59_00699 [Syntrophorhabdus sp. PtaB.Bin027]|nr:MAG: hypothetical protein A4E59_00699 [Syntrophorhabdus sp. PtaB.Bin027]